MGTSGSSKSNATLSSKTDAPSRRVEYEPGLEVSTPLPGTFFLFLAAATATYLLLVEAVKRRLFARRGL